MPAERQFIRPYWWLVLAVLLAYVPAIGYLIASVPSEIVHPTVNAMLNATGTVFLLAGWFAIRGRNVAMHLRCMLTASGLSVVFLASYVVRFLSSGVHRYPGEGADKVFYLLVLFTHMILAPLILPLIVRTIYLAARGRRAAHRRLARVVWPLWLYVSITGVIVYIMLYPIARAMTG